MAQLPLSTSIYQLRLVLAGISPMIWRRLLVSSETTLAQLHYYLQVAFDWSGEHLHRFRIHGKDYGIAYGGGIRFEDNPHAVPLSRFRFHPRESFHYGYDFIADWRVNIRLEAILPRDQRALPVCVGGRAAVPGEEYADPLAYLQQLDRHRYEFPFKELGKMAEAVGRWLETGGVHQALGDLEELREALERVSEYQEFQLRRCDRREMNRRLRALSDQEVTA
ncbi:MAG: plasmid pRiA4b ORF-3 family protein [Acidobacteriaceae bacterium]|nr:plasmid pRiA4b ORF-3 family protein [Acidobacteriaceae bacterium]